MEVIEFNLDISTDMCHQLLDDMCKRVFRGAIRSRLRKLGIQGRTTYYTYLTTWNYTNREQYRMERFKFYPAFLSKETIEDWIMWYSGGNVRTIENVLVRHNIQNVRISVMLNPLDKDTTEEIEETQETWE